MTPEIIISNVVTLTIALGGILLNNHFNREKNKADIAAQYQGMLEKQNRMFADAEQRYMARIAALEEGTKKKDDIIGMLSNKVAQFEINMQVFIDKANRIIEDLTNELNSYRRKENKYPRQIIRLGLANDDE